MQCSQTCGSGVRHRNVTCSRNTGVDCDPQKKPLSVTTCYFQDCPQVADNFGMEWSGSGWSSKEVFNEINSIPEVKPPPKYSTTRAQPRNNNGINSIIEGDFHYHNNIENIDRSPESSIQVDDFYYDYNFINFHEDLSDDFENDGNDSGDSHKFNTPQEAKPTHSMKKNAYVETTKAPVATSAISKISKGGAYTLETEEPVDTNLDNMTDNGNAARNHSENLDDFLSEDFLLPVSTTHSPSLSPTQHSQTLKERHDNLPFAKSTSTMPSLVFTTKEPAQDVKYGAEAENNYGSLTEDSLTENGTVTHKHAAPTPGYQTTIHTVVTATMSAQETEEHDGNEYSYNEKNTLGQDLSAEQENTGSPEPMPETIKTEDQLDESASEIPQTTSQSIILQTTFTLEDLDLHQTNFNTVYATSQYSWNTDHDLSTTSFPASEKSTPVSLPFLQISGNQEASDNSTPLTGTEVIPPTALEGATQPSPADFLPATRKHKPTEPAFTERAGTDSSSQALLLDLADFDYNEIVFPTVVRSSSNQLPSNTAATPQQSTTLLLHKESPTPPTHPPILWPLPVPTSVHTSASTQITIAAYWITGNWSAVSLHESSLHCRTNPSCVSS